MRYRPAPAALALGPALALAQTAPPPPPATELCRTRTGETLMLDLPPNEWVQVAVIGEPAPMADALGLPADRRGVTWEAFAYRDGGYVPAEMTGVAEGLWVLHIGPDTVTVDAQPYVQGYTECATGHLCTPVPGEGWSMVGNPYEAPISSADVLPASDLYRWTGAEYVIADSLAPGEAAWRFDQTPVTVSLIDPFCP